MKADFCVHTDFVGVPSSSSYDHMSWNQLRLIDQSPLFSVFSHSKTHPYLTQISSALLVTEMVASKKRLEKELGGTRVNIAYPFGDYNQAVITAAQNAGFLLAWAVADNGTFGKPAQYSNPRIGIGKDITTIQAFKTRIKV